MKRIVVCAVLVAVVFWLRNEERQDYEERGEYLIENVEQYRIRYGRLPESITALDEEPEMGQGPYYEKLDSATYAVYFCIGFDNTLTYHSNTQEWIDGP